MRRFEPAFLRIIGLASLAAALSGCGLSSMPSLGDSGLFSSKKQETWTPIITEDSMMAAARTNSDGPSKWRRPTAAPSIQVEAGQRDMTVYEGNRVAAARLSSTTAKSPKRPGNASSPAAWSR